jgi:ADP-dependent NAD(P)H-hydrate dehydratase
VHAMAGRRLSNRFGRVGYLARELVDEVPATIASL